MGDPVVIYILGAGNSGSTMLSMVLGAHSNAASVGELPRLDQYRALDLECSCGAPVSRCELWGAIDNPPRQGRPAPITPTASWLALWRYRRDCLRRDPYYLDVVARNIDIYRQIAEETGKQVIVDAAKDPLRLYYLFRSGHVRLLPIWVVRDGRAYIDSMKRRGRMSVFRATFRWARMNFTAEKVVRFMSGGTDIMRVDYSEFANDPEACVRRICETAGLGYEPEMLEYYKQTFHNIAGTRTRKSLKPISPQEGWRERLSPLSRLVFTLIGGQRMNKRFGIKSVD